MRLVHNGVLVAHRFSIDRTQLGVLCDRYLDILLGDPKGLFLLVFQAPLIAFLVVGVWSNISSDTLTLYFVLCLSAFFLGAANGSREIVKERAIFLKEKMFGLSVGAYVLSKLVVQSLLVAVQSFILTGTVHFFVGFRIQVVWVMLALALSQLAGVSLGLLVSAGVKSPDKAVMAVPLLVIPQILFSDIVLRPGALKNWAGIGQKMMPVHWSYAFLKELWEADVRLGQALFAVSVLGLMTYGFFLMTNFVLSTQEY